MERPAAVTHPPATRAAQPFRFSTGLVLQEATGLRAGTLPQLAGLLRKVPEACIYYHTHYFLLSHHYLAPEPTNDFAYWVRHVLGDERLGELLASLDILEYPTLERLREALVSTIESHLEQFPLARMKFVSEGEELFFVKSVHVIMPTALEASTLEEFAAALAQVSIHALYFHIFDARLRLGRTTNDFAAWFEQQLGLSSLAERVSDLDPYAHSLVELRATILAMVRQELAA